LATGQWAAHIAHRNRVEVVLGVKVDLFGALLPSFTVGGAGAFGALGARLGWRL